MESKNLYLFDFDGTITHVDTLFDFLKFSFPDQYGKKFLHFTAQFILAKLGLKQKAEVKRRFINSFLLHKNRTELSILAQNYYEARFNVICRKSAIDFIKNIENNHKIYIVSASLDIWLTPFAKHFGAELICTQAEFDKSDTYTGNFATPNCNFEEKKTRILKEIDLASFSKIYAFGDSKGDYAMFSLASQHFRKKF
ncbi:HAD-IB family hydrolase [Moheibacter stercoris]|uniref:HAD superfamily hydrolase (TIGR01490 family) n=1 Tax=Moheibacter stercoris TaxID=1628251 RepID=A0ABV2LSI8_9FLAO